MAQKPRSKSTAPHSAPDVGRSFGFGRNARLLTPAQFGPVFKKNQRSADKYWTLLYTGNDQHRPRLGMAVAKKKIKNAVDRNRVKRLVRESFRTCSKLPAVDIVVLPTAKCTMADNAELTASLDKHWARIAIKCGAC